MLAGTSTSFVYHYSAFQGVTRSVSLSPLSLRGVRLSVPASIPKNRSTAAARRKLSRALAIIMMTMLLAVLLAAASASAQQRRIQLDDLAKDRDRFRSPDLPGRQVHRLRGVASEFRRRPLRQRTGAGRRGDRRPESADLRSQGRGFSALVPERRRTGISRRSCPTPRTRKTTPQRKKTARRCSSCR